MLATNGLTMKAKINNKGIQKGLSNPKPLGIEEFQSAHLHGGTEYRGNLYSNHGTTVYTYSQVYIAESNLQLRE